MKRVCAQGHTYFKSSDCPTCPRCESARKPAAEFMSVLAAPARRALEGAGLTTLARLARYPESQVAALHGMGPNALTKLRAVLKENGLAFAGRRARAQASRVTPRSPAPSRSRQRKIRRVTNR